MDGERSTVLRNSVIWPGGHFDSLRASSQFCDVTLLCEDGASFPAHKVILSSQSEKLRTILAQFPASPFCLYLAGVPGRHLSSLLAFIYSGQVRLSQADLPAFLSAAETLQVSGLLEHQQLSEGDHQNVTVEEDVGEDQETVVEIEEGTDLSDSGRSHSEVEPVDHENIPPLKRKRKFSEIESTEETKDLKLKDTFDDIDVGEEEELWDDVKTVSFEFIKSTRSKHSDGLLVTHDRSYRFSKNQTARSGKAHYYYCSERNSGCKASAVIQKLERFDEIEGRIV